MIYDLLLFGLGLFLFALDTPTTCSYVAWAILSGISATVVSKCYAKDWSHKQPASWNNHYEARLLFNRLTDRARRTFRNHENIGLHINIRSHSIQAYFFTLRWFWSRRGDIWRRWSNRSNVSGWESIQRQANATVYR